MSNENSNPFLSNVPVVFIARAVRRVGNEEITTPDTQVRRVWGRIKNSRTHPPARPGDELLDANGAIRKLRGLDDLTQM